MTAGGGAGAVTCTTLCASTAGGVASGGDTNINGDASDAGAGAGAAGQDGGDGANGGVGGTGQPDATTPATDGTAPAVVVVVCRWICGIRDNRTGGDGADGKVVVKHTDEM